MEDDDGDNDAAFRQFAEEHISDLNLVEFDMI